MSLAGRRVLVTRPEGQAQALAAALCCLGAEPVMLPMLVIEPLAISDKSPEAEQTRARIRQLDCYTRIIFSSTNAVTHGLVWIGALGPQWPSGVRLYAIGTATAEALAGAGLQAAAPAAVMDSDALLALPELQAVAGERILIVRGVGGRGRMAAELRTRGACVDYAETYRRCPPQYSAAQRAAALQPLPDAALVASGETLRHLVAALRDEPGWQQVLLVVPGARVAQQAAGLGFGRVVQAEHARDAAMLAALQQSL